MLYNKLIPQQQHINKYINCGEDTIEFNVGDLKRGTYTTKKYTQKNNNKT